MKVITELNTPIFFAILFCLIARQAGAQVTPDANNILYVDQNVSDGSQNGNSWANAITDLRDALAWVADEWDSSGPPLQVWVAEGVYTPTEIPFGMEATFQLFDNVGIYGGFAGTEDNLNQRDRENNLTVLSGDIDEDDEPFDPEEDSDNNPDTYPQSDHIRGFNSLHVVTGSGTGPAAILDGFTITGGHSADRSGNGEDGYGGGMINENGSPTLANLTFSGNSGGTNSTGGFRGGAGAIFNNLNSSPTLTNVTFYGNHSSEEGAMFNISNSNPILIQVIFSGNAAGGNGGGMVNFASFPVLTNVNFSDNSADGSGGGMYNLGSSPALTNVIFSGNKAGIDGGGMYNRSDSSPTLTNTIIWGNTADGIGNEIFNGSGTSITLNFSLYRDRDGENDIVEGDGFTADNSLTEDPLFIDPSSGDYALQNISPAINTGDPFTDLALFSGGPDNPLDLAGNPRVFDGAPDPDIIDIGAYEFQGEPFTPEANNGRVLASNLNGYIFMPGDFDQSSNDASVIVKILPVNGDLELNGSAVSPDDEISLEDIDNGDLTYMPAAGEHGVNVDSFDFTVKESGIESDTYSMTMDVGAATVELTGAEGTSGEGWRFLGNPSDGDSYGDLLGPIWTKGVPGSDSPGALFPNIYTLDQPNYQWQALGNMSNTVSRGQAFLVYVYSDDDNNGSPDGFPKTLTSGENWQPLTDEFSWSTLDYDPDQGSEGDSHYLIANPHPVSLDFCEFTSTNAANSVDIWDPAANGGNGDYVNLSCGVDDVFIAPFQGFWVRTTDTNPVLEIPEAAYLESAEEGYFKQPSKGSNPSADGLALAFSVQSQDGIFTNTARILFSEEGTPELDAFDAPKLSPAGLASRWLSFHSLDEGNRGYALQSLSSEALAKDGKITIPLDIQTTETGRYTLNWTLPETHIFSGSYFLRDNRTGEVMELREGGEYQFEIDPTQTSRVLKTLEVSDETEDTHPMSGSSPTVVSQSNTHRMNSGTEPRFELLIAVAGIDGFTELGAVPEEFTLAQNYPNPFNPTTVIRYELPQQTQVRLEVYDMLGRRVAELVNGQIAAGRHTVNFDASGLSSGIYLYRLAAGSTIMTRKLTVVK